jgi:hypothetical protein
MHLPKHCLVTAVALALPGVGVADDKPKQGRPEAMAAGTAEMLRYIPKHFALLKGVDPARRQVTLILEGETEPKAWPVAGPAEFKVHAFWARLEDFRPGERVWVWFELDRKRQPRAVLMLADELSQQDIHDARYSLGGADPAARTLTVKSEQGQTHVYPLADGLTLKQDGERFRVSGPGGQEDVLAVGDRVYVQTAGQAVRRVVNAAGLTALRQAQQARLAKRWAADGLPGRLTFAHPLSGELEVMLDHEAMRWARSLKPKDKVRLKAGEDFVAEVAEVRPWRERTQVRLVVNGFDQVDLRPGLPVGLIMPAPPPEVEQSEWPPDVDRPRSRAERIEWVLASTYCPCGVANNICTGMFYTLASCNPNECGLPNIVRGQVADLIDKGLSDRQILEELKKSYGPALLKPHLVP